MNNPKPPTLKKLQQQVDAWNNTHPVGTLVKVRLDNGACQDARTRYPAQVLSGHSAVIWVVGIRGCYALDRIAPIQIQP